MTPYSPHDLIVFESRVRDLVTQGKVSGPVHCSGGNEEQLIEIFKGISREDFVFSTYRSHYHALLHGLSPEYVMAEIQAGRSMSLSCRAPFFFTSAIVGGCLPIATGLAAALKRQGDTRRVWCFVGDMAASAGTFHDCEKYARCQGLPIGFVIEDNGMSTYTPTAEAWGSGTMSEYTVYHYDLTVPHIGASAGAHI